VEISRQHLNYSTNNIFRNKELEAATDAMEQEFQRVLNSSSPKRVKNASPRIEDTFN
jgi:hypothetical protein